MRDSSTEPMTALRRGRLSSPLGELYLAFDEVGVLHALWFEDEDALSRHLTRWYEESTPSAASVPECLAGPLADYFAGDLGASSRISWKAAGTPFQRRVWSALSRIPVGTTTTYGALACDLDSPSASRAVGLANGANPIAIVVPCHRVVGADGTLTGYAGGIERKRWLLAHEGALIPRPRTGDLFAP